MFRNIQWNRMKSIGTDLVQFRFSFLRETSGKHVTSETIQSLGQFVTESSVTSGHEYITFVVSTDVRNPDQTIQKFVQDQEDQDTAQNTPYFHFRLNVSGYQQCLLLTDPITIYACHTDMKLIKTHDIG